MGKRQIPVACKFTYISLDKEGQRPTPFFKAREKSSHEMRGAPSSWGQKVGSHLGKWPAHPQCDLAPKPFSPRGVQERSYDSDHMTAFELHSGWSLPQSTQVERVFLE